MALIIITGILTAGIIPLLAAIGWGIELFVNLFKPVNWGYWENVAVGLIFSFLSGTGVRVISFTAKRK